MATDEASGRAGRASHLCEVWNGSPRPFPRGRASSREQILFIEDFHWTSLKGLSADEVLTYL